MPFFQEIFILSKYGSLHRKCCDSLKKTKAPTFASLYVVKKQTNEEVTTKYDHNTSVRLVITYDAGRVIDLPRKLRHELIEISDVETNLSFQMS